MVKRNHIAHCLICTLLTLLVTGCSGRYGTVTKPSKEHGVIKETHSEFSNLANNSDLPMQYISEGKIGVSKVEAALEAADAGDLQAQAKLNKELANFSVHRKEVEAQVSRILSEADALRKKHDREHSKAMAQITAREAELDVLGGQKDIVIDSLAKEGKSKYNDIVAKAREAFELETAHIKQAKEIRNALETESKAKILDMTQASNATRERASATVLELKSKATALQQETKARIDELTEQIKSVQTKTKSEADILMVTREALLRDSETRVKELRSKADTILANLANEEYRLKLAEAETIKTETQAKTKEKSANAPTRFEKAMAEIDRLRAETQCHQENAASNYESMMAEIQAKLDDEVNEIKKIRISADRTEQVARSEFIKAEAAARAEAARQTALHAEAVAEAQKLEIIAEAEAEAARIKQEVLEEIAQKKAANKVEIDNYTTPEPPLPEEMHEVPEVPQVEAVAPRIEPEHIAAFRTSLAEVMHMQAQADAHQLVAEATFTEAKTNLEAVKAQEDAIATEQFAIADALEAQARSRFSELEIKTEKEMDIAESKYRQHLVNAQSFKKEKEAEALDYQSQANALEQIANARANQLQAEEEALNKCGQKDVEELKVKLWAVEQRGDAQYAKLTTEAKSIGDSQEALALQIDAQIDSARRTLDAELERIENSIRSSEVIAKADYQQALTQANVLQQKTEAEINRTNAQFDTEQAILLAQIERDKKLALSQLLRSKAACDRMVADANASRTCEIANIDARHATAQADMNIMLAENTSKREAAKSYLDAVKTRFKARVEQVKAERAIDLADAQYAMAIKRTDLESALGQALAARENSNRKLAELQKRQSEMQTASMVNWSAKLAKFKDGDIDLKPVYMAEPIETAPTPKPLPSDDDVQIIRTISNL